MSDEEFRLLTTNIKQIRARTRRRRRNRLGRSVRVRSRETRALAARARVRFPILRRRSRRCRRRSRRGRFRLRTLSLPATTADGNVAEDAAFGPVAAAVLAEMAGLREVVVVVVAELGVERIATRTLQGLLMILMMVVLMRPQPPVSSATAPCREEPPPSDRVNVLHFKYIAQFSRKMNELSRKISSHSPGFELSSFRFLFTVYLLYLFIFIYIYIFSVLDRACVSEWESV
ncbi:hypothetical protein TorRG33x02_211930 [Trema orientale]|uniref:Uncharacterized protein n=1 Tax=Trema orientale TaxID=63057 RepID=A0A2P5EBR2_TREOI|nr:hypothetical protein TorRG33x02_211930 [Trema orientale]